VDTAALLSNVLAIADKSDEQTTLKLIIELGARTVGADEGSLLVLNEAGTHLVFAMTWGSADNKLLGQTVPIGEGITGLAAATGDVQVGAPTYDSVDGTDRRGSGPTAVLAAPMTAGGNVIGVLTAVSFAKDKRFAGDDMKTYGQYAAIAGLLVSQRQAIARLEQSGASRGADAIEQRIADAAGKIARAGADKREQLARVLEACAAMIGA
jgi:transcriptional regulator with GAF, ATPase, and Fis domain